MTWLRPQKPSASMIIALLALFVALGGTSYAAITLGKNSVGSKQLKKNAVTTAKIKNGAVTGQKVKLSTLGTVPSASTADSVTGIGTLRSGQSESGVWGTSGGTGNEYAVAEIGFPLPLSAPLSSSHTIYVSGDSAAHCAGVGQADPGYLCVYQGELNAMTLYGFIKPGGGGTNSSLTGADKTGTTLYFNPSSSDIYSYADGQWTVSAP